MRFFSSFRKRNNCFCTNCAPLFWRTIFLCCREGWQRVWWPEPCMYQSLSGSYWWKNSSSSLNLVNYLQPLSSWWLYARLSNIHHKLWLQHWWILVWDLLHFLASSWIDEDGKTVQVLQVCSKMVMLQLHDCTAHGFELILHSYSSYFSSSLILKLLVT